MLTFIDSTPVSPSSEVWEAAYRRFETPEEEVAKFVKRLRGLGADCWPRDARIAELFCGRGNGLHALTALCFKDVEGIDLSPTLAGLYEGSASITVGDCRQLPWPDGSKDVLIVQGGLHHLPELERDLPQVLSQAGRVLANGGRFVAIEPWLTPFLQAVHAASFSPLRRLVDRVDAFATMVEHERETYERWLTSPELIRAIFDEHFATEQLTFTRGKMLFVGTRR
jgi:SAM-dependent methyltransferase